MNEKSDKITILSYSKVWKVEKKIYAIHNLVLPAPVSFGQLGYWGIFILVMLVLSHLSPIINGIPTIVRFILIPYLLTDLFLKRKLDGKSPQKFFVDYMRYLLDKNTYIERFHKERVHRKEENITINWNCSKGSNP